MNIEYIEVVLVPLVGIEDAIIKRLRNNEVFCFWEDTSMGYDGHKFTMHIRDGRFFIDKDELAKNIKPFLKKENQLKKN